VSHTTFLITNFPFVRVGPAGRELADLADPQGEVVRLREQRRPGHGFCAAAAMRASSVGVRFLSGREVREHFLDRLERGPHVLAVRDGCGVGLERHVIFSCCFSHDAVDVQGVGAGGGVDFAVSDDVLPVNGNGVCGAQVADERR